MRKSRFVVVWALATPLVLIPISLVSCTPGSGLGTGTGVTGGGFAFSLSPVVVLSSDLVRGIAPLTVRFSSGGSTDDGLIISRLWNFGDGQTSRDISPSHTFNTTGEFTVTLTLTDDAGAQASQFVVIFVTDAPVARISVNATTAESAPATFGFDASSSFDPDGEIEAYQWDFGDGSREVIPVVVHTFAVAGTYRVRLTVTDNTGITGRVDQNIEVGIRRPRIQFREPPQSVTQIVVSKDSPLWVDTVYDVEPNVPRTVRAGLDGDADPCESQAVVFNTETGQQSITFSGHDDRVTEAIYTSDGALVLTTSDDRTIKLYSALNGDLLQTFGGSTDRVTSVAFSPDDALFVAGVADGSLTLRNRLTGDIVRQFTGHTAAVNSVAFSPDGSRIVSGGDDRRAIVWETFTGQMVADLTGHAFGVTSVAFSPTDATLVLTGSVDQTARLWDVISGSPLVSFEPQTNNEGALISGHANSVTSVAFSPDGSRVLTGSDDRTAKLWSAASGAELLTISGHSDRVASVAFSPDGATIATGSADASARTWDAASGAALDVFQPCASTIASVMFSPDGANLLLGVAAQNDIQLDVADPAGNDLNLTVPSALVLKDVPVGQYFLWAEIDTDRTSPSRTYSQTTVSVIAPFTAGIDNFTPRIPLINDRASIVVAPVNTRQVFDLGPLSAGDRLHVSLLATPGYKSTFTSDDFSILILDAEQKMFAWYESEFTLFTPDAKIIIGHNSPSYYIVSDRGSSVDIRIERGVGTTPRQQRVFIEFRGGESITVGGLPPRTIPAFNAALVNPGWGGPETTMLKTSIADTVRTLFAPWNIVISTSDEGPPPPQPFQTIYFGGFEFFALGLADYLDPRNETLTGSAIVFTDIFGLIFPGDTATQLGARIGCVGVHEIGHLLGLRHVDNQADIMSDAEPTATLIFTNSPLSDVELPNGTIGTQDAPLLFNEIIGSAP